jgi:hypothetical protein
MLSFDATRLSALQVLRRDRREKGILHRGPKEEGAGNGPFTAAQCRGWTLLGCVVERYPWSRGNVDAKGAPVTLLTLLGHPPDVGLNSPAPEDWVGWFRSHSYMVVDGPQPMSV